jgi:hypothetical protein
MVIPQESGKVIAKPPNGTLAACMTSNAEQTFRAK